MWKSIKILRFESLETWPLLWCIYNKDHAFIFLCMTQKNEWHVISLLMIYEHKFNAYYIKKHYIYTIKPTKLMSPLWSCEKRTIEKYRKHTNDNSMRHFGPSKGAHMPPACVILAHRKGLICPLCTSQREERWWAPCFGLWHWLVFFLRESG
jgi:hypothetical protein